LNIEDYREYCLAKKAVTEEFPFDNDTLVYKVSGKIFALCDVNNFESINLKCDPEITILLRELYDAVQPGYHMNKQHWNTVQMNQGLSDKLIKEWIDHSYDLVFSKLPKAERLKLL